MPARSFLMQNWESGEKTDKAPMFFSPLSRDPLTPHLLPPSGAGALPALGMAPHSGQRSGVARRS
jgi:hypothetical protein